MRKERKDGKIRNWYRLAQTSKLLIFLHVVFGAIRVAGLITSPIFAAKVTVALVAGNFNDAWMYLAIELGIVILTLIAHDQVYRNGARIFSSTYKTVQSKIYKKAYRAKSSNFQITSKEKLLNIIGSDIDVVSNFGDTLGVRIARGIQMLVTLIIVFSTNWMVGLAILTVSALNFVILVYLNRSLGRHKAKLLDDKDHIYEKFTQILSNQDLIKQYNIGSEFADDYFKRCDKYTETFTEHKKTQSIKDNFFVMFYKVLLFAITCLMIFLVKDHILSLEIYLIIVPYLLTSVELVNELINITFTIEETNVSTMRINTVLNFTDDDFIAYGNVNQSTASGNSSLYLMNVSYTNEDVESTNYGFVQDVSMQFASGKINVIKGRKGCGKRAIFHMIARKVKPDKGTILLNDINLYDYDKETYLSNIFNGFAKPKFLNDSIINNFNISGAGKEKIDEMCKLVGVYDYINTLDEKFDTNIYSPVISAEMFYLMGLVMSMLKHSKILSIYEVPSGMTPKEIKNIKEVIVRLSNYRTILLFTHLNSFDDIASVVYKLDGGKIVEHITK